MTRHDILKDCNGYLKEVAKAPALSCVEYYFIPWLQKFSLVSKLYPETIVSYTQAEKIVQTSSYTQPQGIPRIQELAERYGLVTHKKCEYAGDIPTEKELVLLRVTSEFFRGAQTAWREDHYVRLTAVSDGKMYLVNEYPLEVREADKQDRSWLQGECLVYRFHADKEIDAPSGWREIETEEISPTVSLMRDALLLYRVSLRRLKAFAPSAALDETIDLADRIFFASAMASKKNPYERSLAAMWRKDIICAEQKFREKGSCRTH